MQLILQAFDRLDFGTCVMAQHLTIADEHQQLHTKTGCKPVQVMSTRPVKSSLAVDDVAIHDDDLNHSITVFL